MYKYIHTYINTYQALVDASPASPGFATPVPKRSLEHECATPSSSAVAAHIASPACEHGGKAPCPPTAAVAALPLDSRPASKQSQLFFDTAALGLNPKLLPQNTPDLWNMAEAIERHHVASSARAANGRPLVSANELRCRAGLADPDKSAAHFTKTSWTLANAIVIHRASRGANGQAWLQCFLSSLDQLLCVGGGAANHVAALQKIAVAVVAAHDARVESGEVIIDIYMGHTHVTIHIWELYKGIYSEIYSDI